MSLDPRLAQKHVDEASSLADAASEAWREEGKETRKVFQGFYNNLALFSGGTIALSVTYLGYLKTLATEPSGKQLLIGSWFLLVTCLAASLFWGYSHGLYCHYAVGRTYVDARKRQREKEADGISFMNVINLTREELQEVQSQLREVAHQHEGDAAWNRKRENFYLFIWTWSGRLAQVSFFAGIILLVAFALQNI